MKFQIFFYYKFKYGTKLNKTEEIIHGDKKMYIPHIEERNHEEFLTKRFLEYDKNNNQICDNLYLDTFKIGVKMPISQNPNLKDIVKFERFIISNNVFITSY